MVVVVVLSGGAFAGELGHSGALLDRLAGQWVLSGKIAGKETTHDISADWTLNHGYLRIHEISREKGASGGAAYEAIVFISYNGKTEEHTCIWLDSTSNEGLNAQGLGMPRPGRICCHLYFEMRRDRFRSRIRLSMPRLQTRGNGSWIMLMEESGSRLGG